MVDENGNKTRAPSVGEIELKKGAWLSGLETSGGGYGDPLLREPARVLDDVLERYVSPSYAADVYGVVLTGQADDESLVLDLAATNARRAKLKAARIA